MSYFIHFITSVIGSFYSGAVYRDRVRNMEGIGAGHLFLLAIILSIPLLIGSYLDFSHFRQYFLENSVDQMPTITVNKGKVSIDKPSPYVVKDLKTGRAIYIFDTSSSKPEFSTSEADYYITQDSIYSRVDEKNFQYYDLTQMKSFTMTPDEMRSGLAGSMIYFWLLYVPLVIILIYIVYQIVMLFIGIFTYLLSKALGVDINYKGAVRLTVLAFTVIIILRFFMILFNFDFQYSLLALSMLFAGYILFGVTALKKEG